MSKSPVAVIGSGLMGVGIATQYILGGHEVTLYDLAESRLHDARALAAQNLDEILAARAITIAERDAALARLRIATSLQNIVDAKVVFEAVPEVLEIKHDVYHQLESIIAPNTPIASNTSGFDPDILCAQMRHPERFLIAHFWNPPYLLPLVEIVPSEKTAEHHLVAIDAQLEAIGLQPILLKKPITGFIGNRIQFAILRESLYLLRLGIGSAEDIDKVVRLTLGRRYQFAGPLASADLGGLHTMVEVAEHLMPDLAKDETVINVLRHHVKLNETGIRSGQGFYAWTPERKAALKAQRRALISAEAESLSRFFIGAD